MAKKIRPRKREIALAVGAGALAALAAAGILSDGFGGPGSHFADQQAITNNHSGSSGPG